MVLYPATGSPTSSSPLAVSSLMESDQILCNCCQIYLFSQWIQIQIFLDLNVFFFSPTKCYKTMQQLWKRMKLTDCVAFSEPFTCLSRCCVSGPASSKSIVVHSDRKISLSLTSSLFCSLHSFVTFFLFFFLSWWFQFLWQMPFLVLAKGLNKPSNASVESARVASGLLCCEEMFPGPPYKRNQPKTRLFIFLFRWYPYNGELLGSGGVGCHDDSYTKTFRTHR